MYLPQTYFKVDENGFIGIGTDNPDELLHLNGGLARFETEYGYADFGALDNQFFHFQTDMSGFNFNKSVKINGGRLIIENANGQGTGLTQIALNEDGTIRAREVKVDLQTIPDYVFANDYNLMNLDELRIYIKQYQHLPNIKNEKEFKDEGSYALGKMNVKLLEKIEELTLYILQLEERISQLENK